MVASKKGSKEDKVEEPKAKRLKFNLFFGEIMFFIIIS